MSYDETNWTRDVFQSLSPITQRVLVSMGMAPAEWLSERYRPAYQPDWVYEASLWRGLGYVSFGAGLAPGYLYGAWERGARAGYWPAPEGAEPWTYAGRMGYYEQRAAGLAVSPSLFWAGYRQARYGEEIPGWIPQAFQRYDISRSYWEFQQQFTPMAELWTGARLATYAFPEAWPLRAFGYGFYGAAQRLGAAAAVAPYAQGMTPEQLGWTSAGWAFQYPTWPEWFGASVLEWTGMQVASWAGMAALGAGLGGAGLRGALGAGWASLRGAAGISLMQPGLDILLENLGVMGARYIAGQPVFQTPEEQAQALTQMAVGGALIGGGLAYQYMGLGDVSQILGPQGAALTGAGRFGLVGAQALGYFAGYYPTRWAAEQLGATPEQAVLAGWGVGQFTALGVGALAQRFLPHIAAAGPLQLAQHLMISGAGGVTYPLGVTAAYTWTPTIGIGGAVSQAALTQAQLALPSMYPAGGAGYFQPALGYDPMTSTYAALTRDGQVLRFQLPPDPSQVPPFEGGAGAPIFEGGRLRPSLAQRLVGQLYGLAGGFYGGMLGAVTAGVAAEQLGLTPEQQTWAEIAGGLTGGLVTAKLAAAGLFGPGILFAAPMMLAVQYRVAMFPGYEYGTAYPGYEPGRLPYGVGGELVPSYVETPTQVSMMTGAGLYTGTGYTMMIPPGMEGYEPGTYMTTAQGPVRIPPGAAEARREAYKAFAVQLGQQYGAFAGAVGRLQGMIYGAYARADIMEETAWGLRPYSQATYTMSAIRAATTLGFGFSRAMARAQALYGVGIGEALVGRVEELGFPTLAAGDVYGLRADFRIQAALGGYIPPEAAGMTMTEFTDVARSLALPRFAGGMTATELAGAAQAYAFRGPAAALGMTTTEYYDYLRRAETSPYAVIGEEVLLGGLTTRVALSPWLRGVPYAQRVAGLATMYAGLFSGELMGLSPEVRARILAGLTEAQRAQLVAGTTDIFAAMGTAGEAARYGGWTGMGGWMSELQRAGIMTGAGVSAELMRAASYLLGGPGRIPVEYAQYGAVSGRRWSEIYEPSAFFRELVGGVGQFYGTDLGFWAAAQTSGPHARLAAWIAGGKRGPNPEPGLYDYLDKSGQLPPDLPRNFPPYIPPPKIYDSIRLYGVEEEFVTTPGRFFETTITGGITYRTGGRFFEAQQGLDRVFTERTTIQVAESGPEHVKVTPLQADVAMKIMLLNKRKRGVSRIFVEQISEEQAKMVYIGQKAKGF